MNSDYIPSTQQAAHPLLRFGLVLAAGLVCAAAIIGYQMRNLGASRASITVKGLAERPVKADYAEWTVTAESHGADVAETLHRLRAETKALEAFLNTRGFTAASIRDNGEQVEPRMIDKDLGNRSVRVQDGFNGKHTLTVSSKSLNTVLAAHKAILDFKASGRQISFAAPSYLVTELESVKMSLIASATQNARARALEFVKHSDTNLGSMRSAAQGAFYILPNSPDAKTDEYGGVYDKSTIDKVARVVVTVEFNLQ